MEAKEGILTNMPGVDLRFATSCGWGDVGERWVDWMMLAGYSHWSPALMQ
jgi:hypothetical protein